MRLIEYQKGCRVKPEELPKNPRQKKKQKNNDPQTSPKGKLREYFECKWMFSISIIRRLSRETAARYSKGVRTVIVAALAPSLWVH